MSTIRTNDTTVIDLTELLQNFGQSSPENNAQVNSFKGLPVSTPALYVSGTSRLNGPVASDILADKRLIIAPGTQQAPAIGFKGDTGTGIFQPGPGQLEIVSGGSPITLFTSTEVQFFVPIAVPPGGAFVINGPISQNATGVVGGSVTQYAVGVTTVDATPTDILSIPAENLTSNRVYVGDVSVACVDVTSGVNVGSHQYIFRARKLGPTFTFTGPLQLTQVLDPSLAASTCSVAGGSALHVRVQGVAATTIKWTARIVLTIQDL